MAAYLQILKQQSASYDSSVGERMNLTVCPPCGTGLIPGMTEYFKGFFSGDHTLPIRPEPVWQKMAQYPLNGTTTCGHLAGKPKSNYEQTMTEVKKQQQKTAVYQIANKQIKVCSLARKYSVTCLTLCLCLYLCACPLPSLCLLTRQCLLCLYLHAWLCILFI